MTDAAPQVVIGLSAVVLAIRGGEIVVLTVRPEDVRTHRASDLRGLPFGPFDPAGHRTFELALRAFVNDQTGFRLGYVEQLYTFGDHGRDAPLADLGAVDAAPDARMISVGYLALTPQAAAEAERRTPPGAPGHATSPGRTGDAAAPPVIEHAHRPGAAAWAGLDSRRMARARGLFALDGAGPWNEERVLERYELLYEAGPGARRPPATAAAPSGVDLPEPSRFEDVFGRPMMSDHRRILATALGRLRGKLKYRPVVFELMPEAFTLSDLQRAVEAISGVAPAQAELPPRMMSAPAWSQRPAAARALPLPGAAARGRGGSACRCSGTSARAAERPPPPRRRRGSQRGGDNWSVAALGKCAPVGRDDGALAPRLCRLRRLATPGLGPQLMQTFRASRRGSSRAGRTASPTRHGAGGAACPGRCRSTRGTPHADDVEIAEVLDDAIARRLASSLRLEGAEHPVPDDQDAGVVAVEIARVAGVVDPVVRGGVEHRLDRLRAAGGSPRCGSRTGRPG